MAQLRLGGKLLLGHSFARVLEAGGGGPASQLHVHVVHAQNPALAKTHPPAGVTSLTILGSFPTPPAGVTSLTILGSFPTEPPSCTSCALQGSWPGVCLMSTSLQCIQVCVFLNLCKCKYYCCTLPPRSSALLQLNRRK
jgi:hypothetical protein